LYSSNTLDARITISDALVEELPAPLRETYLSGNSLDLVDWSMDEMNVPPYPARRVYRSIARKLSPLEGDVRLEIFECPDWRTGKRITTVEKLEDH